MDYRLLLDTSSLMFRAFFALPRTLVDGQGQPINALHGYLDMTARLLGSQKPDAAVHVYDHDWRPAARVAAYPGYKAERPPDPEGLPEQFAILRELLDACGLPQAEAPGWEADDAIAALCAEAAAGSRVDIVTGDRDLIQLVTAGDAAPEGDAAPSVRVLFTVRGVSELATFDEAAVLEKYGVPPRRYADFAMLRGDPSDGLPGVAGIGEKTARTLVQRYPSVDALLADLDAQSPRLARSLDAARPYLAAMRQVVPVRRDVAVRVFAEERDDARLDDLAARYNLKGPIRRLREALAASSTNDQRPTTNG
jgi:5'-3' exonuclease